MKQPKSDVVLNCYLGLNKLDDPWRTEDKDSGKVSVNYSANLRIPKNDTAELKKIKSAFKQWSLYGASKQNKKTQTQEQVAKKIYETALDDKLPDGIDVYEQTEASFMILKTNCYGEPPATDKIENGEPVPLKKGEIRRGDKVQAWVTVYYNKNRGDIQIHLEGLYLIEKGEETGKPKLTAEEKREKAKDLLGLKVEEPQKKPIKKKTQKKVKDPELDAFEEEKEDEDKDEDVWE